MRLRRIRLANAAICHIAHRAVRRDLGVPGMGNSLEVKVLCEP